MRIAVAAPSSSKYSETFIRMQMEKLPCALRIFRRAGVDETVPGGAVGRSRLRLLRNTLYAKITGQKDRRAAIEMEVGRRIRAMRVTAVLANYGHMAASLVTAADYAEVPLIAHFHGYDAHKHDALEENQQKYALLARRAAAIVAVSYAMAAQLRRLGLPDEKIHVTRCGVEPENFPERSVVPAAPLFFGVGRFVDKKAPYLTLLAFARARQQLPSARLVLGGEGPLLETCRNLARYAGLGTAVEFPGIIRPDEVSAYMRSSTAYVQHSIVPLMGPDKGDSEGTPVSVLEAMCSAVPVIATRHAGIGEVIVHGETGLLVEERDVDGMASSMVEVALAPEMAQKIGTAARKKVLGSFTATHYINDLLGIIRSVSKP